MALSPLAVGIDQYPRLPTYLLIWVWVPAALLRTGTGVQTLTPVKAPTHNARTVGTGSHSASSVAIAAATYLAFTVDVVTMDWRLLA